MLAKAMASESNATFLFAEGNQFLSRYADGGSEKVHEFFGQHVNTHRPFCSSTKSMLLQKNAEEKIKQEQRQR